MVSIDIIPKSDCKNLDSYKQNPHYSITQNKILAILNNGILSTKTIRELLGISKSAANVALRCLRKKQKIYQIRWGLWGILNG